MNIELAAKMSIRLWAMHEELNSLLCEIKDHCNTAELVWYRRQFAELMGTIDLNILDPIYREHPHLMPPELSAALKEKP
jgi:hypothetical protein